MKQVLTSLALVGSVLTMNAQTQILNYGFETSDQLPGVVDTVNLYDAWKEAGGTFSYQGQPAYEGENAFYFSSPEAAGAAGGAWERVLRFTNLPLRENTSYRVSFYGQANSDAQMGVAIMRGELNADMPLVCAPTSDGGTAVQQKTTLTDFQTGQYVRKTAVFWSPSLEVQQERYNEVKSEGTLPDGVFLRLSFLSAADYLVDNIVVEESSIAGVDFNGDVIRVNPGYSTNAAALAKAADGTAVMDVKAFTLKVNDVEVAPESAEIKSDGFIYLFLDLDTPPLSEDDKVTLSYDGSYADLIYSTTVAPESWTNPNRQVVGFENEVAYFNEYVEATSVAYEEAELVTSDPEESSFELSENISEFTLTFNKEVYTTATDNNDAPVATLTNSTGFSEVLAVKAGQPELTKSITFVRTGTEALAKGEYTITVEGVTNAKDVARSEAISFSFEVGKITVASTTYTELLSVKIPAVSGVIPDGWTVNNEGEIRASGSIQSSGGPRAFNFTADGDEVEGGLYIRALWNTDTNSANEGSALYGDLDGYELTIPAGDVQLTTSAFMWKGSGSITVEIKKYEAGKDYADMTTVASVSGDLSETVEGVTNTFVTPDKVSLRFTSDGGRYLYKAIINVPENSSWKEVIIAGFTVYSYVETEGVSSESEYVFQEKFSSTSDNYVPAAGSGWELYDNDVLLTKGSNGSGASSRIFVLSAKNLPAAYYSRMLGTASKYYGIYGNGGEGEPVLELEAVKYEFTYYAVNWKSDLQTCYFQLLNADDEVIYSREDEITPNINSSKSTVVEAQKVNFNLTIPESGQYKLKFWFSGEAMVGNISIMKMGSPAAYWKNLLAAAVLSAQEEYEAASQPAYAGTTYDKLGAAIKEYSDPDMHTPAAYEEAIANIESLTKAMYNRRVEVSNYSLNLENAAALLAKADTTRNYTELESYAELKSVYDLYSRYTSLDLDDATLAAANVLLADNYSLLDNMINECVGLLTDQVAKLAAQIVKLDATQAEDSNVLAAGNALSDDQDLAKLLKLKLTSVLYKTLAESDPFTVYDAEYDQTVADSLDLTGFIQNADLYTTATKRDGFGEADVDNLFPGWTIKFHNSNTVGVQFSWSSFSGSATHPYTDAFLYASWGPAVDIAQTLDIVPVGVYSISAGTEDSGDRVSDADSAIVRCTFQYNQAAKSDTMLFRNDDRGTYYDLTRAIFANAQVPAVEGQLYGSVKISASLRTYQSIVAVDAFKLHMTGKLAGFDYAAAAKTVDEEYAAGIDRTYLPTEAPTAVRYYNLSGRQIAQPAGICIKIENYANGYMVVKKIVVK